MAVEQRANVFVDTDMQAVRVTSADGGGNDPATEAKQDSQITELQAINTKLTTLDTRVDGLETLLTATNALLTAQNPTVLFAEIDTASSGSTALVAAQGGSNKIRVLSYAFVAASAVNVEFRSGATGVTGAMPVIANSGVAIASARHGLFETAANQALNINLSGAVQVSGHISYVVTV